MGGMLDFFVYLHWFPIMTEVTVVALVGEVFTPVHSSLLGHTDIMNDDKATMKQD